jgi:hypothetical protein
LAVGSWQLAVGSWQLAVGSWQLAVGSNFKNGITAFQALLIYFCFLLITAYCKLITFFN